MMSKNCHFCNSDENIEKHHVFPRRFGGTPDEENLTSLCHSCHVKVERFYDVLLTNLMTFNPHLEKQVASQTDFSKEFVGNGVPKDAVFITNHEPCSEAVEIDLSKIVHNSSSVNEMKKDGVFTVHWSLSAAKELQKQLDEKLNEVSPSLVE